MSDVTVKYTYRLLGRECTLLPEATSRLGATKGDHAKAQVVGFAGEFLGRPNRGATSLPLLVAPPLIGKRGDQGRPGSHSKRSVRCLSVTSFLRSYDAQRPLRRA